MASVERWNGNRWRARYRTPDGKSRGKVFDRKTDAENFLTSMEHSKLTGAYIDPATQRQTFADFADEWAEAQGEWKGTTRDAWPPVRSRLVPSLGRMPLGAIDRLVMQSTQRDLSKRYARSTTTTTM